MMGVPESPKPPHLYPQALQLKLYQAFIFSIPILFSIILFLLFYLFYLKKTASNNSHPPTTSHTTTYSVSSLDFKMEIDDELSTVLFDEELRRKDSQCCVCLGEFVKKEELLQVPSCKHIFHTNCLHLWLHTNSTCPLCRSSILLPSKLSANHPPPQPAPLSVTLLPSQSQQSASLEPQREDHQPGSSSVCLTRLPREGSVVINIQTHDGSN